MKAPARVPGCLNQAACQSPGGGFKPLPDLDVFRPLGGRPRPVGGVAHKLAPSLHNF